MKMTRLSRRDFVTKSAACLVTGVTRGTSSAPMQEMPKRPNIVLFMPDTLRAESIGCYGHPVVRTPNIDRLASEGVRFAHCYTQNTVCAPSRCSTMTGWPVHVRGHRSLYYLLRPDEPNLFRYLKQSGYEVYWFGANDLLSPASFTDSVTQWASLPGRGPTFQNPWPFVANPWPTQDPHYFSFLFGEGKDRRDYPDYANLTAGTRVLERDSRGPFCLFLALELPHPPYSAPAGFHKMYDPASLPPLRPVGLPDKPNFYDAIRKSRRLDKLNDADFREINSVYLGMISFTDWLLGELMAALERTGHVNDTALFVLSDHGDWGGDFGLVEKWPSAVDDVLNHVPMIARVPGGLKGQVSVEIIENYDMMATVLDLAGVEAQHTHFARSLMPQIRGAQGDPERAAFCEGGYNRYEPQCFEPISGAQAPTHIYHPKVALQNEHPETITRATMIRTKDYKLVLRPDPGGQSELYDLKRDPRELSNVYGDRVYQGVREDLELRLLNWYVRTSDAAPKDHDPRGLPPFHG